MPRTARIARQEFGNHILACGNDKQVIFKDKEDYKQYIDILWKHKAEHKYKEYKE